jgi:hypothetical protein
VCNSSSWFELHPQHHRTVRRTAAQAETTLPPAVQAVTD